MAYRYKFSALAQKELENSVEWYNKQLFGLGFEFAEVVYDAADAVARNPEAYPIKKEV